MNANTPLSAAPSPTPVQVSTLLSCIESKQTPPFAVLFWSGLQQVDFDYTTVSIARLGQLLDRIKAQMVQKNLSLAALVQRPGAANFLFAITAYLGEYIAKTTGQTATWYAFDTLAATVASEYAATQLAATLPPTLDNTLIAQIGGVYCRPLASLVQIFMQPSVTAPSSASQLDALVGAMQQAIFTHNQVNLLNEPNQVAYDYLAKLKTGRLYDTSIGHVAYFEAIKFDYSHASLQAIDNALTELARAHAFGQADYAPFVAQPANQALLYLLGFYIGTTSSILANVPSKWASYHEMVALFREDDETHDSEVATDEILASVEASDDDTDFSQSIEHSFVQLMDAHFRTPILVVTNRLFGIAPNFPTTAVEFAQLVAEQNRGTLHRFAMPSDASASVMSSKGANLPASWQSVVPLAAALLEQKLQKILTHQVVLPSLWQQGRQTGSEPTLLTLTGMDNDSALDQLYLQLNTQAYQYAYQVAVFDLRINLPMGQCDGLALEIRVTEPALALQLLLPYRYTLAGMPPPVTDTPSDLAALAEVGQLILYPLISNQPLMDMDWDWQVQPLVTLLYQTITQGKLAHIWQAHTVPVLDMYAIPPATERSASRQTQVMDIPLLALVDSTDNASSSPCLVTDGFDDQGPRCLGVGLALAIASFDYRSLSWLGYDAPKQFLALTDSDREYLQVVVPDSLVNDALFSQVEAMQRLYHYGKVVWAVVVSADSALSQADEQVATELKPITLLTADLLYDPTGQANVDVLVDAAQALNALQDLPDSNLSPAQALYLSHRQDTQSRVFGFAYPTANPQSQFASYQLSSSWVWRRHLPDGVLAAGDVVPILLEPPLADKGQPKGRIMVLPSKFWRADFYRYWLLRNQQRLGWLATNDLMPMIVWQAQQGLRYPGKGLEARIFPKFKLTGTAAMPAMMTPMATKSAHIPTDTTNALVTSSPLTDVHAIPVQPSVNRPLDQAVSGHHMQGPPTTARTVSLVPAELQQQLLAEQARLKAQLSTKDSTKERQLYLMVALVVGAMLLFWASRQWLG